MRLFAIILILFSSCAIQLPAVLPVVMTIPGNGLRIAHADCWLHDCMPVCFENGGELVWISSPEGSIYNQTNTDACDHIYDVDAQCLTGSYVFECTVLTKCEGCPDDTATLTLESDDQGNFQIINNPSCNE